MTATLDRNGGKDQDVGTGSRIPQRKLILAGFVVVLIAAIATWLVGFSSVFGVSTVAVRGEHGVSAAQVRAAAAITSGTPLVRLDTDAIRARVETLPDVSSATVSTSFPSTVTISVTERVPLGVVRAATGGFMLVDRTGDQFQHVPQRPKHLPLLVVPDGTDSRTTGGAVATVAADLPAAVRSHVASIQALDPTAISLLMKSGRVVRWGGPERSADKARVLPALLHRSGSLIDVTDPDQPYLRP